eukprot:4172354-Ditylum_brightwellii.AAC.1
MVGTTLYYVQIVDPTLAAALSTIAAKHTNWTDETLKACMQLLNYATTHPNAMVQFLASDMILKVHPDTLYLSEKHTGTKQQEDSI